MANQVTGLRARGEARFRDFWGEGTLTKQVQNSQMWPYRPAGPANTQATWRPAQRHHFAQVSLPAAGPWLRQGAPQRIFRLHRLLPGAPVLRPR